MKKSFLALASLAAIAVGCQVETMPEAPVAESVVYEAVTEAYAPATKTSMNSDLQVLWSEGDQVGVFSGYMFPDAYAVTEGAGTTTAKLELAAPAQDPGREVAMSGVAAVYPFSDMLMFNNQGDGVPRFVFYAEQVQKYTEGTFANGSFPMVALTNTNAFAFKNVFGAMKLQLVGTKTVTSVSVSGRNSEPLAGMFQVAVEEDALTVSPGDMVMGSVKLDCGDGVALNATTPTDFYLALPPTVFADGFTVSIATAEGDNYNVTADVANEVKRSSVLVMPVVNVDELVSPISFSAEASASDAKLSITLNQEGVVGFYGLFAPKEYWDGYGSYLLDPSFFQWFVFGFDTFDISMYYEMGILGCYYDGTTYNGTLSAFGSPFPSEISHMISGSSTYNVVVVPVFEGDDPNTASAATATVFEVSTGELVFGEVELPFTEDDIIATYTSVAVEYAPAATNVLLCHWFHEGEELPTEETYSDLMWISPENYGDYYSIYQENVAPGETVTLCVLVADANGVVQLHNVPVTAKSFTVDETLEVSFSDLEHDTDDNNINFNLTLPENVKAVYFAANTVAEFDDENKELASLLTNKDKFKTVDAALSSSFYNYSWYVADMTTVEDNTLSLYAPANGNLGEGNDKDNYVHVVVETTDGTLSPINTSDVVEVTGYVAKADEEE